VNADELHIIAPERRKHAEQLYDFFAKVFPDLGYYGSRRMARTAYFGNSHYDWKASRIGFLGDEIVTHFGVWDYQMRIGAARVRTGGVGAVGTHGDYRRQGLMDRTARASLQAMRDLGYDMTMLFGIRNYYHKFGYVRAWTETTLFVSTGEFPEEKPPLPLRKFPVAQIKRYADLYNAYYATYTGTAVRPTYLGTQPWNSSMEGYAWSGGNGKPDGYVLVSRRGRQIRAHEYCADADQALCTLGYLSRRWHCDEVRFETLPYASELATRLRRGNCRVETHCARSGSAMVRMLNLPQAMGKLAGELNRRLQSSHLAGWHGDLLLADTWDEVMLSVDAGRVAVAPVAATPHAIRGGDSVVQLLIGTEAPAEVAEAGGMQISGDAAALMEVLFPAQYPQLMTADRY
jgi:predicted acetyltransferase